MINSIRGIILEKHPPIVCIEVKGISYEIHMPMLCFYELPRINEETSIFTHFLVREDAQLLFGFKKKLERALFRALIKVNGIGPKLALTILSRMSGKEFIATIENEDILILVKLPGIGKKVAERLVVEMKDRFQNIFTDSSLSSLYKELVLPSKKSISTIVNDTKSKAISALITLGYKPLEAKNMINKVWKIDTDCETLIREALRTTV